LKYLENTLSKVNYLHCILSNRNLKSSQKQELLNEFKSVASDYYNKIDF